MEEPANRWEVVRQAGLRMLERGEDETTVELDDGTVARLVRDAGSPGGFKMAPADGSPGLDMKHFMPADEPEEGYPDEVPFLAGCMAMVAYHPEGHLFSATWMMIPEPQARFAEVTDWHREHGWEGGGEGPPDTWDEGLDEATTAIRARGASEEELAQTMDMVKSGRFARLVKEGSARALSVMAMPDGRGVITLFTKRVDAEE